MQNSVIEKNPTTVLGFSADFSLSLHYDFFDGAKTIVTFLLQIITIICGSLGNMDSMNVYHLAHKGNMLHKRMYILFRVSWGIDFIFIFGSKAQKKSPTKENSFCLL